MKLELKHVAPYLPYRLRIDEVPAFEGVREMVASENSSETVTIDAVIRLQYKPILKPLRDLTRDEMDIIRAMQFPTAHQWTKQHWNFIKDIKSFPTLQSYKITQKLFEGHYDVFGLIPNGLAVTRKDKRVPMKNGDIDEWLMDKGIDPFETVSTDEGEFYLSDILGKHLKEQLKIMGVTNKDDEPDWESLRGKGLDKKLDKWS
jgi:hypothetical protein